MSNQENKLQRALYEILWGCSLIETQVDFEYICCHQNRDVEELEKEYEDFSGDDFNFYLSWKEDSRLREIRFAMSLIYKLEEIAPTLRDKSALVIVHSKRFFVVLTLHSSARKHSRQLDIIEEEIRKQPFIG